MSLTVKALENCTHSPDYQLELVDGKIIVMSHSGYETVPDLLSGSQMLVSELWSPVFESLLLQMAGNEKRSRNSFSRASLLSHLSI